MDCKIASYNCHITQPDNYDLAKLFLSESFIFELTAPTWYQR